MAQEGFKRKLTAILSADAVGYSRLMLDDEEDTVRTISSYRNVITDLVRQYCSYFYWIIGRLLNPLLQLYFGKGLC